MLQSVVKGFLSFPCFTKPQHFLQSQTPPFQCIGIEVACIEESVMKLNQKTVAVSNNVSIWYITLEGYFTTQNNALEKNSLKTMSWSCISFPYKLC